MKLSLITLPLLVLSFPARADTWTYFQTPSHNIHCLMIEPAKGERWLVDCEVIKMTNEAQTPPKPKSCQDEWGHRFTLDETGKAKLECYGDSNENPENPILAYGKVKNVGGGITCMASEKGLACKNSKGHGFELSKEQQRLF